MNAANTANTKNRRFILVNHECPDFDSIVSTFLWLKATGMKITDPELLFRFVQPGQRLAVSEFDADDTVVHFDTGRRFCSATNDFDHHGDDENGAPLVARFASAARTVYQTFPQLQKDPVIGDIVELTDRVDSGSSVNCEDEESRRTIASYKDELMEFNNKGEGIVLLVTEQKGPREVVSFVSNLETENDTINDIDKLIACILMLDKWYGDKIANKAETPDVSEKEAEKFDRLAATFLATMDPDLFGITDNDALLRFYSDINMGSPCAAQEVHKTSRALWYNPAITEIVELAKLVRERKTTLVETETARQFKEQLIARLAPANAAIAQKITAITLRRGPWDIIKYLPGDEYSERFQLMLGLTLCRAWFNKKTIRGKVQQFIDQSERTEVNNLVFVKAPETNLTSKAIRYQLRRFYRGFRRIDVLVATYCNPRHGAKYIGITMINNNVDGMDKLFQRLKEVDSSADIYIYPDTNFVIYVRMNGRETPLSPEFIMNEAMNILRPAGQEETLDDESLKG
ncbi:hypothetical protein HZB94_01930 [Candidatus Falkowbacteria bacterium]|nr:hypothetical protein [Candidatus Falkowbacteria bacterium]